jgi:integrase
MPLKLIPPNGTKKKNWSIRGTYLRVYVDKSCGTDKRSTAVKQLRTLEDQIERGEYPPKALTPGKTEKTFLSAAVKYMEDGKRRKYVSALIKHFGEMPLSEIDQDAMDAAAVAIWPNGSPGTRNACVYTPAIAIMHYAGDKRIFKRPAGAKGNVVTRWLNEDDAWAVIDSARALDSEFATLLTFLLFTGCRINEALGLTWDLVNLDEAHVYLPTSKNDQPRSIRLRAELVELMRPMARKEGRVFRWHYGGRLKQLLRDACCMACGVAPPARPKRGQKVRVPAHRLRWVNFHTFCHTWATWMRRWGKVDVHGLVGTGRWSDPRSAARYAHVVAREEWAGVDAFPTRGKSVERKRPA